MRPRVALRRFARARNGVAALEFALFAPVLIFLAAGMAEMGRAFVFFNCASRLAAQYASAWADCVDTNSWCATELGYYTSTYAVQNVVPQLATSNLTLNMAQVTMSGTNPVVAYGYPTTTLTPGEIAAAQANFTSGQTGVIVYVSYTYTLAYFPSSMASILGSHLTASYTITQIKS